jgi:hypothetical protein
MIRLFVIPENIYVTQIIPSIEGGIIAGEEVPVMRLCNPVGKED